MLACARGAIALWTGAEVAVAGPSFQDESAAIAAEIGGFSDGYHGVGWLDVEGDADLDLVHTNGADHPVVLWRNEPAGFVRDPAFPEVRTGTSGVLAADLDGDGATDLLLLGEGAELVAPTPVYQLRNDGTGGFLDVTDAVGLPSALPAVSRAATAGDVDGDGDLEVLVVSPGRWPERALYADTLLFLEGGRWVDRAAAWGVDEANANCAASFVHLDDDAYIDLVVGACNQIVTSSIRVYRNVGGTRFDRVDVQERVWERGLWMGFAFGDFDGNGQTDLFATNFGADFGLPPALYAQDADSFGLITPTPFTRLAWGTTAADFDSDGHLDLFQVGEFWNWEADYTGSNGELALGRGDGTFEAPEVPVDLTMRHTASLAAADYDGDGHVDLAVGVAADTRDATPSAPALLHNLGGTGRSLTVRPWDPSRPNHAAIGARVSVELPDGRVLKRQILAGTSYLSTESPWATVGIGSHGSARVVVRWPDGDVDDFGQVIAGNTLDAVRGGASVSGVRDPLGFGPPVGAGPRSARPDVGCNTARGGAWGVWVVAALLSLTRRWRLGVSRSHST